MDEQGGHGAPLAPLRATAIVGLSSIVTLALSVVAAKAYALLVGPDGVGLIALMQSTLNLAVMIASFGLSTSVIRTMALASGDEGRGAGIRDVARAASRLGMVGALSGAAVLIVMREPIAAAVLGSPARSFDVVLLAGGLLLTVTSAVQIALLTGHHRIMAVARVNVVTGFAATAVGVLIVGILGKDGIALAIVVTAAVQLVSSEIAMRQERVHRGVGRSGSTLAAARSLVMLGVPVTASQLAGAGAQLLVPVIVLQVLGTADVGYYRAATVVSVGYLTVFLAALAQDFLPRASRSPDRAHLGDLVERRMRLILGLGVPIILALLAAAPWLVQILYSGEFAPATEVLQWQLVGDLARLPAWVLVLVLLARGRGGEYLAAELIGGVMLIAGSLAGLHTLGIVGAGVGYAVSQVVYYVGVWLLVRPYIQSPPGRLQAVVVGAIGATAILLVSPFEPMLRSVAFAVAALVGAALAWPQIYRLHRAGQL